MSKFAEQITAYEAKRASIVSSMEAIMEKAAEEGTTLDAGQQEEYDGFEKDVEAIDGHLKRLRTMEKAAGAAARPIKAATSEEGTESRTVPAQVKVAPKLEPGIQMARVIKCIGLAKGNLPQAEQLAIQRYTNDEPVVHVLKQAVAAGSTSNTTWVGNLVGDESSVYADFIEFLRPQTIIGKFGANGIPALRRVPFRVALVGQTSGGDGYWVGEGNAKPLTKFDFSRTTLDPLKVANIAVLTMEAIRDSSPSADVIVRDQLVEALRSRLDIDFVDPSNAGTTDVKPASILNGGSAIASTGTDEDKVRLDMRALFQKFIDADNPPTSGVVLMSSTNALALSLMVNALGQAAFPGITMTGGRFFGLPVIVSDHIGSVVAIVNASDIYLGDEGGFTVDMSDQASLQMDSVPDEPTAASTVLVSLWQRNMVGFRAERTINWKRRRTSAVAYLTGVAWGGAVPAS